MDKRRFKICDYTDGKKEAETMELGDIVYKKLEPLIKECIKNKQKFIIDFSDITSLTTKFLNNAIGNLFLNLDSEVLMTLISFSGLDMAKKATLRWSLNVALEQSKTKKRPTLTE